MWVVGIQNPMPARVLQRRCYRTRNPIDRHFFLQVTVLVPESRQIAVICLLWPASFRARHFTYDRQLLFPFI